MSMLEEDLIVIYADFSHKQIFWAETMVVNW